MKKTLFWVSAVYFKPFYQYECHTFNFDIFIVFKFTARKGLETSLIESKNKYKVGLSFLQEKEESLSGIFKKTERVNLYLYKKFILKNDNSLTGSLFYQPSINDFGSDYKISLLTSFNFPITDNLKISFQVSSSLDNEPPDISEKSNHSFSTNFRYSF